MIAALSKFCERAQTLGVRGPEMQMREVYGPLRFMRTRRQLEILPTGWRYWPLTQMTGSGSRAWTGGILGSDWGSTPYTQTSTFCIGDDGRWLMPRPTDGPGRKHPASLHELPATAFLLTLAGQSREVYSELGEEIIAAAQRLQESWEANGQR